MPYEKIKKDILSKKRRLGEFKTVALTEGCTTILKKKLPPKLKDLGSFTIPCLIGNYYVGKALCDLGASINLMPMSVFRKLGIGKARPTTVTLQLADRSYVHSEGKIEDVLVRLDKFIFPADFVILECEVDKEKGQMHNNSDADSIQLKETYFTEESEELMETQQFENGCRRNFE
ncbi:uncharacterized protein [Gossypium hirsutum]|uniref:Aspartic peptidase DDI1-type domain-containing protein n=1 Tax=Gossypium hirsutum TaxID=3635 RepID=A0A1U8JKF8_GOSHI|nr:uncharacterized protein LOC107908000 [Gossypium hirsutum]